MSACGAGAAMVIADHALAPTSETKAPLPRGAMPFDMAGVAVAAVAAAVLWYQFV